MVTLPSREQLLSITPGHLDDLHEWHRAVVLAVIDGQYVDRETIDYEAAQKILDLIDQLVPALRTSDDARPIVDAALKLEDEPDPFAGIVDVEVNDGWDA